MTSIKPTSVPSKTLAQSINGSATSFEVSDILGWDGVALTSSDFGTQAYGMFHNSAKTAVEIFEFDPATIASSAIDFVRRGLKFDGDLTTEVSGNKLTWVKGDTRVLLGTDVPQLFKNYVDIHAAQTIDGAKTFAVVPKTTGGDPVDDNDLTRKAYVNALVLGTLTTINVIVPGTAGETIAPGNLVYFDDTQNKWYKTDADTAATVQNVLLSIAQGAGTANNPIAGGVMLQGVDDNQSGLTEGQTYYASNTAGGISSSAGTTEVTIGIGKSATELYFNPRFDQVLTEDQQDALAGTSGTPSVSNKFATDADTSATGSGSKIVRGTGGKIDPSWLNEYNAITSTSGEALTANDAVAIGYYQADGGIALDGATQAGTVTTNGSGAGSFNLTIGSNSNRALLVFIGMAGNNTVPSSLVFAGNAMTTLESATYDISGNQYVARAAIIVAPTTGTNALTFSGSNSQTYTYVAYSLYNVDQTTPSDVNEVVQNSGSSGVLSRSITPTSVASRIFWCFGGTTTLDGGILWKDNATTNTTLQRGDSGPIFPLQTVTSSTGVTAVSSFMMAIAIKPVTTPTLDRFVKASASNSSATYVDNYTNYRSNNFAGFALSTVSPNSAVTVITNGLYSSFSGLTAGARYYLSNTGGAISTAAGTVSKLVGKAVTSAKMIINIGL